MSQRISAEPAPGAQVDDPGNRYDTDDTLFQVMGHNQVLDRLCPTPDRPAPDRLAPPRKPG